MGLTKGRRKKIHHSWTHWIARCRLAWYYYSPSSLVNNPSKFIRRRCCGAQTGVFESRVNFGKSCFGQSQRWGYDWVCTQKQWWNFWMWLHGAAKASRFLLEFLCAPTMHVANKQDVFWLSRTRIFGHVLMFLERMSTECHWWHSTQKASGLPGNIWITGETSFICALIQFDVHCS